MPPARLVPARPRTWPQRLVLATGVGIVVASVAAVGAAGYFGFQFGQIDRVEDLDLNPAAAGEPANYLVVGTDSREGLDPDDPDAAGFLGDTGCNCTDTIMVVRVDPEEHEAHLLSFPRDLYLPIAGTGKTNRINTAHAHGVQTLIDTIDDNFGIPINHYVEIDFVGFEQLVDAVGGVPLWFESPVRDEHTGLDVPNAGCQVLQGEQARKFVRSRYLEYQDEDGDWRGDPTADLGRITRQQVFIRRSIDKAVSKGLSNPITLNELVSAGVANVSLDENLDAGDLLALGRAFAGFDSDELIGYTIPSEPHETPAGALVELPILKKAQTALNVFRGLPPGTISPEAVDVTVLNGSGITGRATDAAGALGAIGFNVVEVDTYASSDVTRTTIHYGYGAEPAARRVAQHFTGGAALVYDEDLNDEPNTVIVVIGQDFTTLHDQPAPEGSPDYALITTSTTPTTAPTGAGGDDPATATTTTVPEPTTTTTVLGYSTGDPPDGVSC